MMLPKTGLYEKVDEAIEANQEGPRSHLGVSMIGQKCERKMWLSFHWAVIESFDARILRLFSRGQEEEQRVVKWLKMAGLDIQHTGTDQKHVDFGCHISGSMDGMIYSGLPEAPHKKHVLEIKTHSDKSFQDVKKNGVEKSKPDHWWQMQGYMLGSGVDRALYVSVNKNDDELYFERIRLDEKMATERINRAKRIALEPRLPAPMSTEPSWYECKFCAAHDLCFVSKKTKEVNCRTCSHATATPNGKWFCERYQADVPTNFQRTGCSSHVIHPELVPFKYIGGDGVRATYLIDGKEVVNGENATDSRTLIGPGAVFKKVFNADVEVIDFDAVRGK